MSRAQKGRPAEKKQKLQSLEKVAEAFSSFRPARQVLKVVRAVPTRFVQLDHATKVGGLPIERFMLVSGPSSEGKTVLALGLLDSFLKLDHFGMLIDAERTTPITWVSELMGARADHPGFFAIRPTSYEETVAKVRGFVTTLKEQRDAGHVKPDTSALIVVDSIRKLVPKNILDKILKDADKHGIDGMGGRAAQIKAAMNAQWMDELIPLLEDTQTAMLVIARETEDPKATEQDRKAGRGMKVGGGSALYYDSSMVFRVEREGYVQEKITREDYERGVRGKVFGEKHRITIKKTKVAGREDKQTQCFFHTSNGVFTPFGFDPARDLLELGEKFELVERAGSWFSFAGEKIGNGQHNAVKNLYANPGMLGALDRAVRRGFETNVPTEFDEDGVVSN